MSTVKRKLSTKFSSIEAQYERCLSMLRSGEKSTIELRRGGVMMPAARVKELIKLDYTIVRVALRDLWDEWGYLHPRVAIYALISEPGRP